MSITTTHLVPAPLERVWEWHTRPGAVQRLTPPFLPMSVVSGAESLRDGTTVLKLPAGQKWIAQHVAEEYIEGSQFVDVAENTPVKQATQWKHTHLFEQADSGTRITDTVDTRVPEAMLKAAFAYRQRQLVEDLAFQDRLEQIADVAPKTIAMTGSRGLVGSALSAQLTTAGHTVVQLVRGDAEEGQRHWDMENPDASLFSGIDAVIHLAGESIMGRFTDTHKSKIYSSRIGPTRKLAQAAADAGVETFVSASAVGFYGTNAGDRVHTEADGQGDGFLAEVVAEWEAATDYAHDTGVRTVNIRTGLVLSGEGGLLPVLRFSASTALSARFGDGDFWMSWVAIDDLTDIYIRALFDDQLSGPVNATAPNPVTNAEMSKALTLTLNRPELMGIPSLGPKVLLGEEGARELALADQRVEPAKLNELGHHFRYPTLQEALDHELGKEELL
ncbi:TIGR01777 family oxidoreductase [Corynebacterium sp. CCUG 65737]|uniref:TIGR01777 family oxidoreductase n=1 Tax=unclassified Corynebacterium TaxID=2624378 RepID=UPI00210BB711|nr:MULTISPECIES: TIGR01777 family oxidoreductase [unclassified Corynebacterium]MCQ4618736.1 TIGR01777 family oxidoreductase [Corynebacterium pseudogenitalium]MCQ4622229.1 TIGR01777 family oxidoreductase [Corynebacterium sp. CCUG 70398]MCQ4625248.1 TIGR01777 family oxidoreductase [Corynebacterium sp. CCUG 69979]MCQ4627074.1 TIGR01777 family oxidoreductase [Corynebacterium sp. CCUG 65737]